LRDENLRLLLLTKILGLLEVDFGSIFTRHYDVVLGTAKYAFFYYLNKWPRIETDKPLAKPAKMVRNMSMSDRFNNWLGHRAPSSPTLTSPPSIKTSRRSSSIVLDALGSQTPLEATASPPRESTSMSNMGSSEDILASASAPIVSFANLTATSSADDGHGSEGGVPSGGVETTAAAVPPSPQTPTTPSATTPKTNEKSPGFKFKFFKGDKSSGHQRAMSTTF